MDVAEPVAEISQPKRKSRLWLWIFVGGLLAGLLMLLIAVVIVFVVISAIKSSEPYQMALEKVQNDPAVIEQIGQPIEDVTRVPSATESVENGRGSATLNFKVEGPGGIGRVSVQARCMADEWSLTTLDITFEDGQRVPLDVTTDSGLGEAPKWPPE